VHGRGHEHQDQCRQEDLVYVLDGIVSGYKLGENKKGGTFELR